MKNRNLSTSWKNSNNLPLISLPPDREFFLSLSGGADSTALLFLLKQNNIPFTAVHFTHGIRAEDSSTKEREFCHQICADLQVPLKEIPLDVMTRKHPSEGIEEAARRLRLEAWQTITAENKNVVILTAHHAGDAVENMFLRLMRGGNTSSATSLRFLSEVDGMTFCRPLLSCTKQQLIDYLASNHVHRWITDETNSDSSYLRNFLRNEILPQLYQHVNYAEGGLRAAYQAIAQDADFLQQTADALTLSADREFWAQLHPAIRTRAIRRFLAAHYNHDIIPTQTFLTRFTEALEQQNTQLLPIPGKADFLQVSQTQIAVINQTEITLPAMQWNWQNASTMICGNFRFTAEFVDVLPEQCAENECYCDADQLPPTLLLAPPAPGESMTCFGIGSTRKLKKLFTDAGISSLSKKTYPILRTLDREVLWIPFLRRSDRLICTGTTRRILRIRAEKNPVFQLI